MKEEASTVHKIGFGQIRPLNRKYFASSSTQNAQILKEKRSFSYCMYLDVFTKVLINSYNISHCPVIWLGKGNTGLSKKMDGIWNRYNLKSTGRIYTFGVLKCSEKFKVLDLP